jgi:hypothetical protein
LAGLLSATMRRTASSDGHDSGSGSGPANGIGGGRSEEKFLR